MKPGLGMLEKIIDEAQGNVPASLVIKNISVFNLITGETVRGDIAVCGDRIVGVVYVQLPSTELTSGLDTIGMIDDTYLGLRQGGVTLWERGEQTYSDSAERMAVPVSDSGMRLVAGTSPPPAQARIQGVQDAWRTDLRRKLEEERKEFLKSLPPHRPWSVIPTAGCEL